MDGIRALHERRASVLFALGGNFLSATPDTDYTAEALSVLGAKKNLRLLKVAHSSEGLIVKSISGGFLAQTADVHRLARQEDGCG